MHLRNTYTPYLSLCALLLALMPLRAQADLDRGLIGYWPMDSSAHNASLNCFPRTDFVLQQTSYANGWNGSEDRNGALYFYGESKASLQTPLPTSEVSISFWFKTSDPSGGTMLDWEQHGYGVQLNPGGRLYCWIYLSDNGFYDFLFDSENLTDGEWHHFVMTYNTNTFSVFVDGKTIHNDSSYGTDKPIYYGSNDNLNLGHSAKQNKPFSGSLDELLLYNRPLSTQEINILAKGAIPVWDQDLETGLLVHLPFHNDDLNKSPNGMDALFVETVGTQFTEACNEEIDRGNRMKYVNGQNEQIKINEIIQLDDAFSLGFFFNSSSSKESFVAGWDSCGYRIILNPRGHNGKLLVEWWTSPTKSYQYITDAYLNDGRCHHLVLTFDKGDSRIYLDGKLINQHEEAMKSSQLFYASSTLLFGKDNNQHSSRTGFQGELDEICLYNRALAAGEIQLLQQSQFSQSQTIDVKRYPIRGSRQNQIPSRGGVLFIKNQSGKSQKLLILNGTEQLESLKLKPDEEVLKQFPAGIVIDNLKVVVD